MKTLFIGLRLVHILSGVFWVGSSVIFGFFISPTVAATAEAGQKFMIHLVTKARITGAITVSAILTVLAGSWLYWIDSEGLTSGWITAGAGLGFGLGGILGFIGLVFGILVGKNVSKIGNLGSQIQGRPSPAQLEQLQAAQKQLSVVAPISTIALVLALVCMATARYWGL